MGQLAFEFQEIWLREVLNDQITDLFVSRKAERQMVELGITMPEVLCLLRNGSISNSEKMVIGAEIIITGRNCDEEELWAVVHIDTNMIRIEVLSVGNS